MITVFYQGVSASSNKGGTISELYKEFIENTVTWENNIFLTYQSNKSDFDDAIRDVGNYMSIYEGKFLFIGKSLGGVRTYELLSNMANKLPYNRHINVALIDPHGIGREFDENHPFTLPLKWKAWIKKTGVFVQQNSLIKGSLCTNADLQVDYTGNKKVDHMNISKQPEIISFISECCERRDGSEY